MEKHGALSTFNEEYRIVRRLLVKGKWPLRDVRAWLEKHGAQTAVKLQAEYEKQTQNQITKRADRELDFLRKLEGEGTDDE